MSVTKNFKKRLSLGLPDLIRSNISVLRSLSKTLDKSLSFGKRKDIVCDVLTQKEKQSICERMMQHMIEKLVGNVFLTYVEANDIPFAVPDLVNRQDPYLCKEIPIVGIDMEKNMFWCRSRQFIKGGPPPARNNMRGFFLAGSRNTRGRVFAFRPWVANSQAVHAVAEMDNVSVIQEKDGEPVVEPTPTPSSSSSDFD